MSDVVKAQLETKIKCEQIQQSLKDLHDWEKEMKFKESQFNRETSEEKISPPIRGREEKVNRIIEDPYTTKKKQLAKHQISAIYDKDEAEQAFNKGNEICKRAKEGEEHYVRRENQNAIEMFTQAINVKDSVPKYYVHRAYCFFNLERYEECIEDCETALKLDKDNPQAYYRRMLAYECIGNNELAYLDCKRVLQVSMDKKEIATAEQCKARIAERLRKEANELKSKGNDCLASKDYKKAIEYFTQAISKFSEDTVYYHNRSLCYFHLNDVEKALSDCNSAIAIDSKYFRPYYQRMRLRELRKEYSEAIKDCRIFLKLVKDDKQRLTAEKDLERLLNISKQYPETRNWSKLPQDTSRVNFVTKKPHLRSTKPLRRIKILESSPNIPDSIIDQMFNNNTGERLAETKNNTFNTRTPHYPFNTRPHEQKELSSCTKKSISDSQNYKLPIEAETKKQNKNLEPSKQTSVKLQCWPRSNNEDGHQLSTAVKSQKKMADVEESNNKPSTGCSNPFPSIPSTSVRFYSTWCNLRTEEDKYEYLKSLENSQLHVLLGTMSSQMLSDVLRILERCFVRDKCSPLWVLQELAKNPEVGLLVLMFNEVDKYTLIKLFDYIDETEGDTREIRQVKQCFIL